MSGCILSFLACRAVRLLPGDSSVRVTHAGRPLSGEARRRAEREDGSNPRYRWVGELDRREALRLLARGRTLSVGIRSGG